MLFNYGDKKLFANVVKLAVLSCVSVAAMAETLTVEVIDSQQQPISDMVVYLEPIGDIILGKTEQVVEVGQLDRAFTPYVSVMQRGNSVRFHNKDDITHHIYSPVGKNKFSFKIKAGESRAKDDFQEVGEVAMGCNIHDWMSGYLLVLDTPLFGKTNKQGRMSFDIEQLGDYTLVAWHPQLDTTDNRVKRTVKINNNNTVTLTVAHKIREISEQKNDEDFDFLSDY